MAELKRTSSLVNTANTIFSLCLLHTDTYARAHTHTHLGRSEEEEHLTNLALQGALPAEVTELGPQEICKLAG